MRVLLVGICMVLLWLFQPSKMSLQKLEKAAFELNRKFSSWTRIIKSFFQRRFASVIFRHSLRVALKDIVKKTKHLRNYKI